VQNKHKNVFATATSREDSGRIEKPLGATGGLAAAKWGRPAPPSAGQRPSLGFWPPLLEASSTPLRSHLSPWLSRFDPTAHVNPTGL